LIETFKIVHRKYDNNPELFFQLDEGDRREHDQKLFKKTFRLKVRKYAFSNIPRASPVCLYVDWLYTGLDGTYYNSVFLITIPYFFKFMPTKDFFYTYPTKNPLLNR